MTPAIALRRNDLVSMARMAGLALAGVTTAESFSATGDYVTGHIEAGHSAGMDWFTIERSRQAADPGTLHDSVRSIVSVGLPFWTGRREKPDDGVLRGRIARYAWGRDYHRVMKRRMKQLRELIEAEVGAQVEARLLVDTARVFDRAVAARAGLGWFGKNSMIIVPGHGSWVMLGELYLDIDIPADIALTNNCGRCAICLDQCPTGAIVEPYRIHAPRCISYLTIEERGPIPLHLRPLMGDWVFGCDVCQNVCPYTAAARPAPEPAFEPRTLDNAFPSLERLALMETDEFYEIYSGTAVTRAKRRGLARNAAIALGNSNDQRAEPILRSMLERHDEPLARGHAAWALAHLVGTDARSTLQRLLAGESDGYMRSELTSALSAID